MNKCKFCKGYYENLKAEKINIFESDVIQLEKNKLEIKYCPMCGKKLESKGE